MAMYDSEGNYYATTPEEIAAQQAQQQQAQQQQQLRGHEQTPYWNSQLAGLGYTNSEGTFNGMFDPESSRRAYELFTGTSGGIEQKMEALNREFGQARAVQWALNSGLADPAAVRSTGVGTADAQHVSGSGFLNKYVGPLIKPAIAAGGAILGGATALGYGGAGAAGAGAVGDAAAAGAVEGVGGASGGAFTGGFTGTAAGTPEFSGLIAGSPGVSTSWAGGALAPGFFGAEGLGAAGLGAAGLSGAGVGAGTAAEAAGAAGAESGVAGAGSAAGGASAFVPTAGGAAAAGSFLSNPAVLGAGAGALLGSGVLGGGSQAGTIQVEEGLPDWLMPYAKPQLDQYSTQLQNYQTDPYGIMPSAMKEFQNTISGMYLDPSTNKYLEEYFNAGADRVKSSLSPTFGHMQAFGSNSGYNQALSQGLGDFATGLYGGAYAKERDRQSQMTSAAPQFLAQNTAQTFAPYQNYLSTVGQLGKKKQEPYFDNPMGNLFGGALAGAGLGSLWK